METTTVGGKMNMSGPKLSDREGQARAAMQSAETAQTRAAELRNLGNEEHARDYDEIAASMIRRAQRFTEDRL